MQVRPRGVRKFSEFEVGFRYRYVTPETWEFPGFAETCFHMGSRSRQFALDDLKLNSLPTGCPEQRQNMIVHALLQGYASKCRGNTHIFTKEYCCSVVLPLAVHYEPNEIVSINPPLAEKVRSISNESNRFWNSAFGNSMCTI